MDSLALYFTMWNIAKRIWFCILDNWEISRGRGLRLSTPRPKIFSSTLIFCGQVLFQNVTNLQMTTVATLCLINVYWNHIHVNYTPCHGVERFKIVCKERITAAWGLLIFSRVVFHCNGNPRLLHIRINMGLEMEHFPVWFFCRLNYANRITCFSALQLPLG